MTNNSRLGKISGVFGMLFLSLIWGGTFVVTKFVLREGISVGALVSLRFLLGFIFLAAMMLLLRKGIDKQSAKDGLVLGAILVGIFWLQVDGLRFTTASKSGFITGLSVIFTPIASLFLKEKFKAAQGFCAILALVGLFFLVRDPNAPFGGWNRGDSEALACAALCGLHITLTARMSRRSSPWTLGLGQITVVAVVSCALTLVLPADISAGQSMGGFDMLGATLQKPEVWIGLLYLSLLATSLGFYMQPLLQAKITATSAAVVFCTEPVFAVLIATSGLVPGIHEHLTLVQALGGALIVAATLLAEIGPWMVEKWGRKKQA
ncbi:MAG: DMT family transporter [Holophagales bacterium]|nr:DMT family transporter [Holophagales bacterium]